MNEKFSFKFEKREMYNSYGIDSFRHRESFYQNMREKKGH